MPCERFPFGAYQAFANRCPMFLDFAGHPLHQPLGREYRAKQQE